MRAVSAGCLRAAFLSLAECRTALCAGECAGGRCRVCSAVNRLASRRCGVGGGFGGASRLVRAGAGHGARHPVRGGWSIRAANCLHLVSGASRWAGRGTGQRCVLGAGVGHGLESFAHGIYQAGRRRRCGGVDLGVDLYRWRRVVFGQLDRCAGSGRQDQGAVTAGGGPADHVQGYYTAGTGGRSRRLCTGPPVRLVDTGSAPGYPRPTGAELDHRRQGRRAGDVPVDASAVFVMLTGISSSSTAGYFTPIRPGEPTGERNAELLSCHRHHPRCRSRPGHQRTVQPLGRPRWHCHQCGGRHRRLLHRHARNRRGVHPGLDPGL